VLTSVLFHIVGNPHTDRHRIAERFDVVELCRASVQDLADESGIITHQAVKSSGGKKLNWVTANPLAPVN